MLQTQMTLEIQRNHLDLCSSMRNVRFSQQSMMIEDLLKILTKKKKSGRFKIAYRCPVSKKCCRRVYFFNNHVGYCKTGKHDFSCASQVNNLKDWKFFSHQMSRNRFDPVLTKRDWNCPTIQNLICLNSAANETIQYNNVEPQEVF